MRTILGSEKLPPALKILGLIVAAIAVLTIAAVYAYATAFSYFSSYDDEGYLMLTVRGFLQGHRLYLDIFTYYGPVYFLYEWLLHSVFVIPLTHDATTALCVIQWLVGALILSFAARLATRSWLIASLVFMQATLHLTPLAREPGHPQELVVLLVSIAALIGFSKLQPKIKLAILSTIGAALVFTKVNVGVFYGCALLLVICSTATFFRTHGVLFLLGLMLSGLLPFVLMRPNLNEGWAVVFSFQSCTASMTAAAIGYLFVQGRKYGTVPLLCAVGAFSACSVLFVTIVMLSGTPFISMFQALITEPARLGGAFCIPLKVPFSFISATLAMAGAVFTIVFRHRLERLRSIIAVAKGLFAAIGCSLMVTDYNRELAYLVPWCWLLLIPAKAEGFTDSDSFGRLFLCLMAIWQSLQAYPVAGTQAVVGTLLLPLVYGVSLHDVFSSLRTQPWALKWSSGQAPQTQALIGTLGFAALLYLFATQWCMPLASWRYYTSVPLLGLNGAKYLRLPNEQAETYRALTHFLETEGEAFYTIPGFSSLYFWARKAPPTYLVIPERLLLSESQQTRVSEALQRSAHPLIVINESAPPIPESVGPLGVLIHRHCREIARFGTFHILEVTTSQHLDASRAPANTTLD